MSAVTADENVLKKANAWLEGNYDEDTKARVREMKKYQHQELIESFYRDLEFGTGGLRGIMGVGTNRMNKYTVGMATQGLANYLKKMFKDREQIKVAVAHDSRNHSRDFARITAEVFSANDIKVYLFDDLRPTPELSFAIRQLDCQSGVVVTASHNPKEYNGYKAYWDDGAQLISPHDKNVIDEVQKITNIDDVNFEGKPENIEMIGENMDRKYLDMIKSLSLSPDIIHKHSDVKIVYSPLHGTGYELVPRALRELGFKNIYLIDEQTKPDGNFPTVKSPNPEEPVAMEMALNKAREIDADLVMATDPDADRVGIAVKDLNGEFVLLNGNQTAALLLYYLLSKWKEQGKINGRQYIIKTIVTSEIITEMAHKNEVEIFDVLTGFKFIADKIRELEGKMEFIAGGEESYGYMIGDAVRDKDAVASCVILAEALAWAMEKGKSMFELLIEIYQEFGFYKEKLVSVVKEGKSGAEEIDEMMKKFRTYPPESIDRSPVILVKDYLEQKEMNPSEGTEKDMDLPKSNVLQFFMKDGSKVSMRPSGTEPKIKFYFSVNGELKSRDKFQETDRQLGNKIDRIIADLKIN